MSWHGLKRALPILVAVGIMGLLPEPEALRVSWWSVLPPLIAIVLALWAKQVVISLFFGVWFGASMLAGDPLTGFLRVIDTNVRDAVADSDHVSILVFSLLLGGMVGVMTRSGGTEGVVRMLSPLATTPKRALLATWAMGVSIFFDDYSNTLIVGHSMRPVTDRHRISREKLAFLVDSTAAPVACIAVVSTWVGYQVSVLGDALRASGSDLNPFHVFLHSVPMAFYPFAALALTLSSSVFRRDFGPMLHAERRAASGALTQEGAQPLADFDASGLAPDEGVTPRWYNALLPVLTVIAVVLIGLYVTGRAEVTAKSSADAVSLSTVIGASDPFTVLLWGSLAGLVLAMLLATTQGILTPSDAVEAAISGFRSMLVAVVVLVLAWSLGAVCTGLGTAEWLKLAVGEHLPASLVPAVVFLVAAAVSFATGTSWGTIAILTPLVVPLSLQSSPESLTMLAATVSAILGGSVFGDHCSPISDTTVMSSMASACDHVDHVRTQLPYAVLAAVAALGAGYLLVGVLEVTAWVSLPLVLAVVLLSFGWLSRPVVADPVTKP